MATATTTTRTTKAVPWQSAASSAATHADFSFSDLLRAYYDCRRSKRYTESAFAFELHYERELIQQDDPEGPDNTEHLFEIIKAADVLVPCWGTRTKLPRALHARLDWMTTLLQGFDKPVRIFGLAQSGDPLHPLMLGYNTPLVEWTSL